MKFQTINPATEEILGTYEAASKADVNSAVAKSRVAFHQWKQTSVAERAKLLRKLQKVLLKNKKRYAEIITLEMGKPIRESISEIEKCAWLCEYYSQNAEKFLQDEIVKTEAKKSYVTFEPLGVIGCIMPWNFPFWQVLRFAVPALTAGNTVVLKHSSICPESALQIVEAFERAGFPKNVFQTVLGPAEVGEALIQSNINAISVTGSVETGRRVAELAARDLKKFVLELGGSDPFIVLEDADLDFTCEAAVKGRTINSGQSCIAAKRFIVVKEVAEEFSKKLVELTNSLVIGDPLDPQTQIGPVVREEQLNKLHAQVMDSVKEGAKILTGGRRLQRKGYFYLPTVLSNVTRHMRVFREETFGPVSPIIVVKNEEEAIRVANDSEFGLGASIWTKDLKRGEKIAKKIEAGLVYVNSSVHSDPRMPFGGVKHSGIGRELSHYGLREFVNIKSIKIF
jgi:acyl-CoA reductase-like NAD-dependent aldehyde dehydrogenase